MSAAPLKILAVDDEQLLLWALERACKGRSLDIKTAVTTQQALAEIELCHFDLFLLDFDLKDQTRLELLKAIDERCPYVPIIIMTTTDMKSCELNDTIRSTRKQGAWHLLEKPFSLDRMISFVEVIFQDQGHVKLCLNDLAHNFDSEKRQQFRRPHVEPVAFTFKSIVDGELQKNFTSGILTDISDCGLGLLTRSQLESDQVISFGDSLMKQCGIIAWTGMIDAQTCRAGIRMC